MLEVNKFEHQGQIQRITPQKVSNNCTDQRQTVPIVLIVQRKFWMM